MCLFYHHLQQPTFWPMLLLSIQHHNCRLPYTTYIIMISDPRDCPPIITPMLFYCIMIMNINLMDPTRSIALSLCIHCFVCSLCNGNSSMMIQITVSTPIFTTPQIHPRSQTIKFSTLPKLYWLWIILIIKSLHNLIIDFDPQYYRLTLIIIIYLCKLYYSAPPSYDMHRSHTISVRPLICLQTNYESQPIWWLHNGYIMVAN